MSTENYAKKCSSMFTVARVFALISIVAAHINFPQGEDYILNEVYSVIASIGVIAFLFMSSYYYNPEKFTSLWEILKKKFVTIGIPWLFLGTLAYLYNAVLTGNIGIMKWIAWILGYKTYLYFLTVLFLCFIIFYKTNKIFCICCIPISIISIMLTASGILEPVITFLHITDYLNIFNWIGVFALGQLCKNIEPKSLFIFITRYRFLWIALFLVLAATIIFFDIKTGYFSFVGIYFEIIGALCIFAISSFGIFNIKLFQNIANNSFSIYLIHMPLLGVLDKIYNLNPVIQAISVLLVIAVAHFGLELCRYIICKIKCEKVFFKIFGFRNRSIGG